VFAPLLLAQAQPPPETMTFAEALPALLIILAIICVLNTIVAWLASKVMSFPMATIGRALKLSILQLLVIPVVMVLLLLGISSIVAGGVAWEVLVPDAGPPPGLLGWGIVAVAILVPWLVAVAISGWVYGVGFLRAAVFNAVTWIIAAILGAGLHWVMAG